MRLIQCLTVLALVCSSGLAQGTDRVVDPSGAAGTYTTIGAAMLASSPGDRILVQPGTYPAFQFSRGVHLIGLGGSPADVVIQRIAYHVSIPALDYDTLISNVTVASTNPLDVLSVHGNELAPGTLTIDGCILQNGVYLRGGQLGFYLFINNTTIAPPAGHGFTGEACRVGGPGNFVEIRNTRIQAWDAVASSGVPAGVSLRIAAGTQARVIGSEVLGGDGAAGSPAIAAGGTGIVSVQPGLVDLHLDGGSLVTGGDALGVAPGGHGCEVHGTLELGSAVVVGGSGSPAGSAYAAAAPAPPTGVNLQLVPGFQFASGPVAVVPGDTISVSLGSGIGAGAIGISTSVILPASSSFVTLPLNDLIVVPAASWSATIPALPGLSLAGLMVYMQGLEIGPGGALKISNTAALRLDL